LSTWCALSAPTGAIGATGYPIGDGSPSCALTSRSRRTPKGVRGCAAPVPWSPLTSGVRAQVQIDSQTFDRQLPATTSWEENCFRYCTFVALDEEGGTCDSAFISCEFTRCKWYWALFTQAIFVGVKFTDCTFRGTSFAGCKFVECEFVQCHFTTDNLEGSCSFEDSRWYSCTQSNTRGIEHVLKAAL
jgi:hypothetical protein